MKKLLIACGLLITGSLLWAQNIQNNPGSNHANKFEQLGSILAAPNEFRTAAGAPGPKYWHQRCDYDIKATLDENNLRLDGREIVTYHNNSPDVLAYLWMQLDENQHSSIKNANYPFNSSIPPQLDVKALQAIEESKSDNGYGFNISSLSDAAGKPLPYTVNKTMMRIDLPTALKPGQKFVFTLTWNYKITDRMTKGGRGGYEYFPGDGNYLFTMAQWYPRLCVYSDFQGWQNQQFTGRGEFALTFGNFKVQMTIPADHIVGATGQCRNYQQVLSPLQYSRWKKAQTATEPVEIVTLNEATAAEKQRKNKTKTWIFSASNVRDFAWTSSRKFIWEGMATLVEGRKVMCMSYYGKEAYNLYRKFSTKVVAHTIRTYSRFTIPYPYPVAQSVEAANGMEYPMICFNYGRTDADGTYSEAAKYGMLGVIIHEVGHNFFPMIINSDERQWSWMDEGLNTFCQYLTEVLFDNKFPSRRGPAWTIVDYMKLPKDQQEPIMTNSQNIINFGQNAYSKPTVALNILRETILGRQLFDYAFKEYARRWAFKHPTPADFFRTIEDASAEDLDWFWRGWFYSTDACDISLDSVKYFKADVNARSKPDTIERQHLPKPLVNSFEDISKIRNRSDPGIKFLTDVDTSLRDYYWKYDRELERYDTSSYPVTISSSFEALDKAARQQFADKHFYELYLTNKGGLVMPVIIEWTFMDSTKEVDRIPAQIWRHNEKNVVKFFMKDKEVVKIKLDPMRETADIDESNNTWENIPKEPGRFELLKSRQAPGGQSKGINPMQKLTEKK
jgi:hypothetical protein